MMVVYDTAVDAENRKVFRQYKTARANDPLYRCVLCGEETCISDSMSRRGERLICMTCAETEFDTIDDAISFCRDGVVADGFSKYMNPPE